MISVLTTLLQKCVLKNHIFFYNSNCQLNITGEHDHNIHLWNSKNKNYFILFISFNNGGVIKNTTILVWPLVCVILGGTVAVPAPETLGDTDRGQHQRHWATQTEGSTRHWATQTEGSTDLPQGRRRIMSGPSRWSCFPITNSDIVITSSQITTASFLTR